MDGVVQMDGCCQLDRRVSMGAQDNAVVLNDEPSAINAEHSSGCIKVASSSQAF